MNSPKEARMKPSGIRPTLLALVLIVVTAGNVSAETLTLTFQDGDGGAYSSTQAATIVEVFGATPNGLNGTIAVGVAGSIYDFSPGYAAFVRFPDIIGNSPGQIPPGSTIGSAALQLVRLASSTVTYSIPLRSVLSAWDEYTVTGQNMPSVSESYISSIAAGGAGAAIADITSTVQTWASGAPNWGVKLSHGFSATKWSEIFESDDATNVEDRPLLSVTFTPPTTSPVAPTTWGKVKALYR
jgi:hypothetical protein